MVRAVLAATLSSDFGVYGPAFELLERLPQPGSEEYLNSEKYELKKWELDRPDSLRSLLTTLNKARRVSAPHGQIGKCDIPSNRQRSTSSLQSADGRRIECCGQRNSHVSRYIHAFDIGRDPIGTTTGPADIVTQIAEERIETHDGCILARVQTLMHGCNSQDPGGGAAHRIGGLCALNVCGSCNWRMLETICRLFLTR